MELVLTRIAKRKTYTIGRLAIVERVDDEYLAGEREAYFCDTLEPPALEQKTTVSKEAVLRSPKKAQSLKPFAIPEGRYAVCLYCLECPCSAAYAYTQATQQPTPRVAYWLARIAK